MPRIAALWSVRPLRPRSLLSAVRSASHATLLQIAGGPLVVGNRTSLGAAYQERRTTRTRLSWDHRMGRSSPSQPAVALVATCETGGDRWSRDVRSCCRGHVSTATPAWLPLSDTSSLRAERLVAASAAKRPRKGGRSPTPDSVRQEQSRTGGRNAVLAGLLSQVPASTGAGAVPSSARTAGRTGRGRVVGQSESSQRSG
jgi:hypothetical protein